MNRCPRLHAWCSGVKRFCKHRDREEGVTIAKMEDLWRSKDGDGVWLRVRCGEEGPILRTCERGDEVFGYYSTRELIHE